MENNRLAFKELLEKFIDVCEKNDIWYALDGTSLLGAVRHGGFIPWDIKVKVMMTIESYIKLKRLFKENVVDSSDSDDIKGFMAFFVNDAKDVESHQPFIEIRNLVPTTIKKIKKFRSPTYVLANKTMKKKINFKKVINDLNDEKFEGYILLESRMQNIKTSWIQSFDFNTIEMRFIDLKVRVPEWYDRILTEWYGEDYMTVNIPSKSNVYLSPVEKFKEKQ